MTIITVLNIGEVMFGSRMIEADINDLLNDAIRKYDHAYRDLINIGLKSTPVKSQKSVA